MLVLAAGQIMTSPICSVPVNDNASKHLRGRYNATANLATGLCGTLCPAITDPFFDLHAGS